jgi:hypothetical protein
VPKVRSGAVEVDLPAIRKAADVVDAMGAVIAAAAAGDLTLEEARGFAELLDAHRRALETQELAVKVQLLEAALDPKLPKGRYGL